MFRAMDGLVRAGYSATKLASTGGFLREGNSTVLIGVDNDETDKVLDVIKKTCRARAAGYTDCPGRPRESMSRILWSCRRRRNDFHLPVEIRKSLTVRLQYIGRLATRE